MTRQRTRPSLSTLLTEQCPYCEGHGTILSIETVVIGLFRAIKAAYNKTRQSKLRIIANDHIVFAAQRTDVPQNSVNLRRSIETGISPRI